MSSLAETLRNFCKRAKIPDIVNKNPVKGYEPSYKELKRGDELHQYIALVLRTFLVRD